jgi:TP901 family phage tail tape measure protein
VTTPEGTNFIVGANATKLIDELRKGADALKNFGTISGQQAGYIKSQLTQLEQQFTGLGKKSIDFQTALKNIGNVRYVDDLIDKMKRLELSFERLQRLQANVNASSAPKTGLNLDQRLRVQDRRDSVQAQADREAERRANARDTAATLRELKQIQDAEQARAKARAEQRAGLGPSQNRGILNPQFTRTVGGILPDGSRVTGLADIARQAFLNQGRVHNVAEAQKLAQQENQYRAAVNNGLKDLAAALQQHIAAEKKAAELAARNSYGGPGAGTYGRSAGAGRAGPEAFDQGSFLERLKGGFEHGRGERSTGFQIGQVFRTSLLYSSAFRALGLVEQTFSKALTEAVNFQQGVTELALATDQSRDSARDLANNLADAANSFGLNGTEGIQAGIKAIGVFRATDASSQTQGAVARTASTSILQQSFLSGKPVQDLTANLAAIVQAFGVGAESIGRITDTTTFFEKQFGIAIGSLSESIPAIASLAQQSGFSVEQTAGLAAAVQSRQAGTPAAASGLLSQILTREGEGTVQNVYKSLNITGQTFADRFRQLADKLPSLSDEQRGQVAAAFGKGRSQSAAIGLLEELDRVFKLAERRANGEGDGLTKQQASLRMNDVGGQLAQLTGAFDGLVKEISQTGLLDALGAVVIGLRELAQSTTQLLRFWNLLPNVIQDVVIAMGVLKVATIAGAGSGFARSLNNRLTPFGPLPAGATRTTLGTAGAIQGTRALGGAGIAALGGLPVIGAVAALTTLAAGKGAYDSLHKASQEAADALTIVGETDFTKLEAVKSAQASIRQAAESRRDGDTGPMEKFIGLFTGEADKRKDDAANFDATQRVLTRIADRLAARQSQATGTGGGFFGDLSSDAVSTGYKELRDRGYSAASAIDLLNKAIDKSARTAADAAAIFDPNAVGDELGGSIKSLLGKAVGVDEKGLFGGSFDRDVSKNNLEILSLGLSGKNPLTRSFSLKGNESIENKKLAEQIIQALPDPEKISALVSGMLAEANSDGKITDKEASDIARQILANAVPEKLAELGKKYGVENVEANRNALEPYLAKEIQGRVKTSNDANDPQQVNLNLLAGNVSRRQDLLSGVPEGNLRKAEDALAQNIDSVNRDIKTAKAAGEPIDNLLAERVQTQKQLLQTIHARANKPLQLAAATASANAAFTKSDLDDSAAAVKQAKADLDLAASNKKFDPIGYQKARQAYGEALARDASVQKKSAESMSDLLGAQVGSELANAISAMRDADAAMAAAETDAEKNAALIQQLNAQRAQRNALRESNSTERLSHLDRTNPAQVAREAARKAREELADAQKEFRGAGSDGGKTITPIERRRLTELRNAAEDSTFDAQNTAFSQRLQKAQTALSLGKLSNKAYMDFLRSQITDTDKQLDLMDKNTNGFKALKDRKAQLEGALKEAANSFKTGQFNLGDIQLPTPYEVKRYIKASTGQSAIGGGGTSVVNSNNTISLSGLTLDQMQAIMESTFGTGNTQTGVGYTA